jgi:hypothetical protein
MKRGLLGILSILAVVFVCWSVDYFSKSPRQPVKQDTDRLSEAKQDGKSVPTPTLSKRKLFDINLKGLIGLLAAKYRINEATANELAWEYFSNHSFSYSNRAHFDFGFLGAPASYPNSPPSPPSPPSKRTEVGRGFEDNATISESVKTLSEKYSIDETTVASFLYDLMVGREIKDAANRN